MLDVVIVILKRPSRSMNPEKALGYFQNCFSLVTLLKEVEVETITTNV